MNISKWLLSFNVEVFLLIFFMVIILVFLFIIISHNIKNKKTNKNVNNNGNNIKFLVNDEEVTKEEYLLKDPHFKDELFLYVTFEVFKYLQYAWSNFDYDQIKKITPLSTWSEYVAKLDDFKKKGHQHVIRDLNLVDSKINYISINDYEHYAEVYFSTTCYNYLLATFTNRVVAGSNVNKYLIDYKVLVRRIIDEEHPVKSKKYCENCSKNIEDVEDSICPYCSYMIIPDNYIFQIVKKEVVKEQFMD